MKYKLIGVANIFFASMEAIIMINLLMIRAKLESMYESLAVDLPMVTKLFPILGIIVITTMVSEFILGIKLFRVKGENNRLFAFGILSLVCTILLLFVLIGFSVMSIVMPIYTLTDSL
jgi:hypothetical protein